LSQLFSIWPHGAEWATLTGARWATWLLHPGHCY